MHFLQSVSAKDYNTRVKREGAFWRGRYHPTIIEPGSHLAHCLFYIDLNMLRAGVVKHPAEYRYTGYHELAKRRNRYCIINIDRLINCLEINNRDIFHWIKNISYGLLRTKIVPILSSSSRLEINESAAMYSLTRAGNTKRDKKFLNLINRKRLAAGFCSLNNL